MEWVVQDDKCEAFEDTSVGTYKIQYMIDPARTKEGVVKSISATHYVPKNKEGQKYLFLLIKAFKQRLTYHFNQDNQYTPNRIVVSQTLKDVEYGVQPSYIQDGFDNLKQLQVEFTEQEDNENAALLIEDIGKIRTGPKF